MVVSEVRVLVVEVEVEVVEAVVQATGAVVATIQEETVSRTRNEVVLMVRLPTKSLASGCSRI